MMGAQGISTWRRWRHWLGMEYRLLRTWVRQIPNRWQAWRRFWAEYDRYNQLAQEPARPEHLIPCLEDATAQTEIEPIYFYQDAWAFEKIVGYRPQWHLDIGSHHKFVALLSKVVPLTMVDIRPLSLPLESITFKQGDILNLPYPDASVPSVSCLCVIEHIGLGRYGDTLNPNGTYEALAELKRIVQSGGHLVVSVPIDDQDRIYFNAHRAFHEASLLQQFAPFEVREVRYIFGKHFGTAKGKGFGVACYWLVKP